MQSNFLKLNLFLLVFLCFGAQLLANTPIKSIQEVKDEATKSGKMIMVNFTAEWCLPCKMFEANVLEHPEMEAKIESNFVYVEVDIDDQNQRHWKYRYPVISIPTVLILNEKAEIVHTVNGSIDYLTFNKAIENYAKTDTPHINPKPSKAVFVSHNSASSFYPPTVHTKIKALPNYTITIGSFESMDNALKYKNEIETKTGYLIDISNHPTKQMYRLNIGSYNNKEAGAPMLSILKTNRIDCYIRSLLE